MINPQALSLVLLPSYLLLLLGRNWLATYPDQLLKGLSFGDWRLDPYLLRLYEGTEVLHELGDLFAIEFDNWLRLEYILRLNENGLEEWPAELLGDEVRDPPIVEFVSLWIINVFLWVAYVVLLNDELIATPKSFKRLAFIPLSLPELVHLHEEIFLWYSQIGLQLLRQLDLRVDDCF